MDPLMQVGGGEGRRESGRNVHLKSFLSLSTLVTKKYSGKKFAFRIPFPQP